jgi:hypothetical protein
MGTTTQLKHEQGVIKAFVLQKKQERFLTFLSMSKTRKKLTQELADSRCFDPRFATPIPWNVDPNRGVWQRHVQGIENIHGLLKAKGAGKSCWAISEDSTLDGKEVDLESVLEEVIDNQMGTILSCLPGKLALFASEDARLLLSR